MFFEELIISEDFIEIIAAAIIFYITPYILLMLLIDYTYRVKEKKGSVYAYAATISFITLTVIHVIWAISTATLVNEFIRRIQLTITVLPVCWVIMELVRYQIFNRSIIQFLK
ncbi:MAG: hypothetical protein U9M95_07030 [Candidatus Altiarchaeota archaeon]|nr:hypothetical protein [Candidatus Altiarchaeota archaeon]